MMKEVELLERAGVTVEPEGGAFLIRGERFPFTSILHIELSKTERRGTAHGGSFCEQRLTARVITEDRLQDPILIELGVRTSSSDGDVPDFDPARLMLRARRVARAAARIARKIVLERLRDAQPNG
jgi:hypothetical protein